MVTESLFFIRRGVHRLAAVLHQASSRKLVIMAHGFTGHKQENGRLFVRCARSLAASGISALRFDFMGSGDSSGELDEMTPNTEIADLHAVIAWAWRRGYRRIGILGLSCGGGVSICAVAQRPAGQIRALCTWSSVPEFRFWLARRKAERPDREDLQRVGAKFYTDRPEVDVPESYVGLTLPELLIQGDADLPEFRERFEKFFPLAQEPKRHVVLPRADHVFTRASDRRKVIALTVRFFTRELAKRA